MANRGSPLPFRLRQEIEYHARNRMPKARIAIAVGVDRKTVIKYLRNKFPQHQRASG
jgi:DNA-binding XRE family transcriptional regulator